MARRLSSHDAEALIASDELDIIDVREPEEWAEGHLPGARNVPLATLKANPASHRRGDKTLFVCARGVRSLTASEIAEGAGFPEVYSLDGGTAAWQAAGLTIDAPSRAVAAKPEPAKAADPSCGLPEPGLDVVVGKNMRELRMQRGMSLDSLASASGLSRTLLGQIELGKTPPSVSVVWRIAAAFEVPFSALLASAERLETTVFRNSEARRIESPDGRYSSRALYPLSDKPGAEFYELYLAPHSREDAEPHQRGTRENLVVAAGQLELTIGDARYELTKGDAIAFTADVPHSYANTGHEPCFLYLVMTYIGGRTD